MHIVAKLLLHRYILVMLKFGNCGKVDIWAIHCQCKSVLLFAFVSSAAMLLWSEIRGCASSSLSSPHKIALTLFAQDYDFITHHKHVQHAVSVSHQHVLKVYKLVLSNSYIDVHRYSKYLACLYYISLKNVLIRRMHFQWALSSMRWDWSPFSKYCDIVIVNIDVKIVDLKYCMCMCSIEVCGAEQVLINRVLSCMRDGDYF